MEDRLITEEELADLVGWSLDWVRKQRRSGNGPDYIRLGGGKGHIRYRQSAVDAWLDERTHESAAAEASACGEDAITNDHD